MRAVEEHSRRRNCRLGLPLTVSLGDVSVTSRQVVQECVILLMLFSPNPPMDRDGRCEESGRGRGRYRRDDRGLKLGRREVGGRSAGAYGGSDGGLEWLWEREGGIGHGKRRSGTGLARVSGDVGLAGGSVADGRRQAGRGMARSWARARLSCSFQGQRWGRWRVNRRAERVIRPAEAKTGRLRVLVVTVC